MNRHTPEFKLAKSAYDAARYLRKREEILIQQSRYYHQNKEKLKPYRTAYKKAHAIENALDRSKRRALERGNGADFTHLDWLELLNQYGERCAYCGQDDRVLTIEHKTPISRGGQHTKSNIVPACAPCNNQKFTKTASEYRDWKRNHA